MRPDDDGFGFVSRAERRAADAFYAALMGRRPRARQFGEAFALPPPRPPLIECTSTPSPEPAPEDQPQVCGFFGPTGTRRSLVDLRKDIAQVARDQRTAWHTSAGIPRLENEVSLFWLLVAYFVSADSRITGDQVKVIHANAKALSFASLVTLTGAAAIQSEVQRLRGLLLSGIASPTNDLKDRVDEAIKSARESHFDTKSGPWSAAFVSAVVRGAAIVHGVETDSTKPLAVSVKHIAYVKKALEFATPPGVPGTYHAFAPGALNVSLGDIIVLDRRQGIKETDVTTLGPTMDKNLISHGDIVVDVQTDRVVTIGGNVCNSVRFRQYPVKNKRLVVDRNQLFVQENSQGQVPILPAESCHDPPDPLESQSTKRIFALLSLVEECRTLPAGAGSGS